MNSSKSSGLKKRFYIVLVSREEDGTLRKVPVPLHYAWIFVAVAVIGTFTVAGLAGSYSRMLIKTSRFNQLRTDHSTLQKDYAHLEKQAHEKDVQAASLGSLATEVSAIYGLTASKLAVPMSHIKFGRTAKVSSAKSAGTTAVSGALITETTAGLSDDTYYKSLDTFYSLRNSAASGAAASAIGRSATLRASLGLGTAASIGGLGSLDTLTDAPSLWPVMGPIRSSFGQREDPILGGGEGEFHTGMDISAPIGTPIHATADGTVRSAAMVNGYGRQIILDHGRGITTCYAHMAGFTVLAGQSVVRGQVIGYVGVSGRTTGAHLHYEVRIHDTPVNPHKYLRTTLDELPATTASL